MMRSPGLLYLVTREYAGIAEAGGVKNVTRSLAEGLARAGVHVTVFLPRYGFVGVPCAPLFFRAIEVLDTLYEVSFFRHDSNGVRVVLIGATVFSGKHQVYVYSDEEAALIPGAKRGSGHADVDVMNVLLQKAVIAFALESGERPDIVHCHDAHTALLPALARLDQAASRSFAFSGFLVTIHNAGPGYRQNMKDPDYAARLTGLPSSVFQRAIVRDRVEPFLLASEFAALTTVSPWYAEELVSEQFDSHTEGLSAALRNRGVMVTGITNGIDRIRYCPRDTALSLLPYTFNPSEGDLGGKYKCRDALSERLKKRELPLDVSSFGFFSEAPDCVWLCYQGRIASQKGISTLAAAARIVFMAESHTRLLIMGQGDATLEKELERLAVGYPGRCVYLRGYDKAFARLVVASADFIVLPSEFEPCGLEDMIAQFFGTIPIARAVGGLRKITDGETGFLYGKETSANDPAELAQTLIRLTGRFAESGGARADGGPFYDLVRRAARAVAVNADWDRIIRDAYLPLYLQNIPDRS